MARVNPDYYKVGGSPKEDAARAAASRAKLAAQTAGTKRTASRKQRTTKTTAPPPPKRTTTPVTKRRRVKAMPNAGPDTALARIGGKLGALVMTTLKEPRRQAGELVDTLRERGRKTVRTIAEIAAAPMTFARALRVLREPSKPR